MSYMDDLGTTVFDASHLRPERDASDEDNEPGERTPRRRAPPPESYVAKRRLEARAAANLPRPHTRSMGQVEVFADPAPRRGKPEPLPPADVHKCREIIEKLMHLPEATPFLEPVDPVALSIPLYPTVITHPMDLGTVLRKLTKNEYHSRAAFAADVRLTFENAMTFNPAEHPVHKSAKTLQRLFENHFRNGFKADAPRTTGRPDASSPHTPKPRERRSLRKALTKEETTVLSRELSHVPKNKLDDVLAILNIDKEHSSKEVEIVLENYPVSTLRKLQQVLGILPPAESPDNSDSGSDLDITSSGDSSPSDN